MKWAQRSHTANRQTANVQKGSKSTGKRERRNRLWGKWKKKKKGITKQSWASSGKKKRASVQNRNAGGVGNTGNESEKTEKRVQKKGKLEASSFSQGASGTYK